ncbi:MAG TPA: hypothetical protein VKI19_05180 [Acidimicrobiales bacterium]|nr:hypothetical protein [Acidimicrobiales bacterium]
MGSVPPQLWMQESLSVAGDDDAAVGVGVGGTYLVVELPGFAGPCWVCAPVTDRALDCVRDGRTSPWTVLHHSATGTVDVYRTAADGSLRCSTMLCAALPGARPARAAA